MFKTKKAQAAMEFLMTYGWALLVVLIAIAALAFFGLLNPSRFLPEKCTVPPGLGCGGYAASGGEPLTTGTVGSNKNLTFFLTNGAGETLYNMHVNVPECAAGSTNRFNASLEGQTEINTSNVSTPLNVPEGNTVQFGAICTVANSMTAGDRFRGTINITYQTRFENTMQNHTKSGDLIVAVQ